MLDEAGDATGATGALQASPDGAGSEMQTQAASPEEIASSLGGSARKTSEQGTPGTGDEPNMPEPSEPTKSVCPAKSPASPTSSLPSSASKMARSDVLGSTTGNGFHCLGNLFQ